MYTGSEDVHGYQWKSVGVTKMCTMTFSYIPHYKEDVVKIYISSEDVQT